MIDERDLEVTTATRHGFVKQVRMTILHKPTGTIVEGEATGDGAIIRLRRELMAKIEEALRNSP